MRRLDGAAHGACTETPAGRLYIGRAPLFKPLSDIPAQPPCPGHPALNGADMALIAAALAAGVPGLGGGQAGGQLGGLALGEAGGGLAVVVAGGGLGAVDAAAELHDVQVQLEDAPLAELGLDLAGEDG